MLTGAQALSAAWWIVALVIALGSVAAATFAVETIARKRRNPYLDPWRDREPGELPEVER